MAEYIKMIAVAVIAGLGGVALLTQAVADAAAVPAAGIDVYNVSVGSATGGTFTLTVEGTTTGDIAWNAPAADLETALSLAAGSVTGTGTVADPWVITFAAAPPTVTIAPALLTQAVADASAAAGATTDVYNVSVGSATASPSARHPTAMAGGRS